MWYASTHNLPSHGTAILRPVPVRSRRILSLLAAVLDWDWFFTAQNTQFIVRSLGRRRARWFYGVLGVVLMVMAVFFFFQTEQASAS